MKKRIIHGYREDYIVDDEAFPKWAYNSEYAENLWLMWESSQSDRMTISMAQDTPVWRGVLVKRIEKSEGL
jgi:hypothetical protein